MKTNIKDNFWGNYIKLLKNVVIPYQWEALNDNIPNAEKSYAIKNLLISADLEEGEYGGWVFQDSDIYKWLEAVGYLLEKERDINLEAKADKVIEYMKKAQLEDGYLNTYYIINGIDKRFTNLKDCHELYCLGHLIEGAISYYNATGKKEILDIACKFTDLICDTFGPEENQLKGYPGHQVIEMALVKLYHFTNEDKYLKQAEFFINERGANPNYFIYEWEKRGRTIHWDKNDRNMPDISYNQAHIPVREQTVAIGHAVRAVYMYTGMAMIANETQDKSLIDSCNILFDNIINKQMYITGGIGQTSRGEAFSFDYDLPNNTIYSETCAAIGLIFFAKEMFNIKQDNIYYDTIEKALYNTVIAGMAKDGKHFFYVNPLEVWPEAIEKNPDLSHVKAVRQKWFGCSCCPPNIARLLASLDRYITTEINDTTFINLYIGADIHGDLDFSIKCNYPWDENVNININKNYNSSKTIALRIPGWCKNYSISINNTKTNFEVINGYAYINRIWNMNDNINLNMSMPIQIIKSNDLVRANSGKVCVSRGALVYCLEEIDNGNNLASISLDTHSPMDFIFKTDLLDGIGIIKASGFRDTNNNNNLYFELNDNCFESMDIIFIPYYAWGNRGIGEMSVWLRYQ